MSHQKKNDPLSDENLSIAQKENLDFIEWATTNSLRICNVSIVNALAYDFIQILNNMYLQHILEEVEPEEEKESAE